MAGTGRAPKEQDQRAGRAVPQRGEWVDLPPLSEPVLPDLPEGSWSERTARVWKAWVEDPVTQTYGSTDVAMAVELAYLYEEMVRDPKPTLIAQVRQWTDRLGLNPKGRRDLRFRVVEELAVHTKPRRSSARKRFGDLTVLPGGAAVNG